MKIPHTKVVQIWTDGGCINNPGAGGLGIIMKYQDSYKEIYGYVPLTTNNQMELLAVIIALNSLTRSCEVELYTDSQYVKKGITEWIHAWQKKNWKTANKKPVKNQLLWQELHQATQKHNVSFHWLKGHAGHTENERADTLCAKAIKEKAPLLSEYLHLLKD
ncbi:Ribonuclease HI [Candidatus Hepatincola sp. Av]